MTDEINQTLVNDLNPYSLEGEPLAVVPNRDVRKKFKVPTESEPEVVVAESPDVLLVALGGLVESPAELLEQLTKYGVLVVNPYQPNVLNAIKVIAMRFGLDYRILLNLIVRLNNQ